MRDEFVALLLSQVGQHEGRDPDGTWNNQQRYSRETPGLEWSDGQPWCATFQCWGAHRTPGLEPLWPMTASCLAAVAWWKRAARWSDYPVLGGPFYLGPDGGTHTGTVVAYDADTITTVEANSNNNGSAEGDGVYRKTRPRRGPGSPYGYGVPAFPEGTVSADPRLGGTPRAAIATPTTTPEEDPVPYSLADIAAAVVRQPVAQMYTPDNKVRPGVSASVSDYLGGLLNSLTAQGAQLAALTAALDQLTKALAGQLGADPDALVAQVRQAVDESVKGALAAGINVHVDVNPSSKGA